MFGLSRCSVSNVLKLGFLFSYFLSFSLVAGAGSASAHIVGKNQRTWKVPKAYRQFLPGIGVIRSPRGKCTAFCVARDVIATSQHCIQLSNERWRSSSMSFWFILDRKGRTRKSPVWGRSPAERRVNIAFGLKKGRFALRKRNAKDFEADWALIRLKKPICRTVLQPESLIGLSSRTLPGREKAVMISAEKFYRRSRARRWTYSGRCRFVSSGVSVNQGAIAHTCDTIPGTSGAPIFLKNDEGELVVAAVNSGSFFIRENGKERALNRANKSTEFSNSLPHFVAHARDLNADELEEMQRELKKLRLLDGKADGVFGPRTRLAVIKFEAAIGLPELGVPSRFIYELLTERREIPSKCWTRGMRWVVPPECKKLGLP